MSKEKGYQKEQKNNQRKQKLDIFFGYNNYPLSIHEDIRAFTQKIASGRPFTIILDNHETAIINPHLVSCVIERKN